MKKKYYWLAAVLWTLFIFSNSLQNGDTSGQMSGSLTRTILSFLSSLGISLSYETAHHFLRKAAHFSEYAVLGLLVSHALRKAPPVRNSAAILYIWMVTAPAIDETIQRFVPDRGPAFTDVLIDICGFLCAVLLYRLFSRKRK